MLIELGQSHVVEVAVNPVDRLYCVEAVELEGTPVEGSAEVTVHREVFLLDLEVGRLAGPVVHVVCVVDRVAHVDPVAGVLGVASLHMELRGLLVFGIL